MQALLRSQSTLSTEASSPDTLHRELEHVLRAAGCGLELRRRLEPYLPGLESAYDDAFGPDGYVTEALREAPWLAGRGERLHADQHRFLLGLRELLRRLETEGPDSVVCRLLRSRLLAQLRGLRRDEARLLLDAQLEELGEAG